MSYGAWLIAAAVALYGLEPLRQRDGDGAPPFVASIKRSTTQTSGFSWGSQPGGRWSMRNTVIAVLIREAYPAESKRLVGVPDWVNEDTYDIEAKADGELSPERNRLMLQALLADRFRYAGHYASVEEEVFDLLTTQPNDRRRDALRRSTLDCEAIREARRVGKPFEGTPPANGAPVCGWSSRNGESYRFGGVTMREFAHTLSPDGRVVIDKTGLPGRYEFTLNYSREVDPPGDLQSVFVALPEQVGLRLVPGRASVRAVVVDRIERPSEN